MSQSVRRDGRGVAPAIPLASHGTYSIRSLQQHLLVTFGQQAMTNGRQTVRRLLRRT